MSDLYSIARGAIRLNAPAALVTLVSRQGSTYRKPGARLLVTSEGPVGLMSGGCLEDEIARRCQPVLHGEKKFLSISLDTRRLLGCDGRLRLMIESVSANFFVEVEALRAARGTAFCSTPKSELDDKGSFLSHNLPRTDRFIEQLRPTRRLLAFGSGPDVSPLLELASAVGWETNQVLLAGDPGVHRTISGTNWSPEQGWKRLGLDEQMAAVVMHHQFGRDVETLYALWESPVRYLGLLGSARRRDEILAKLMDLGVDLESRHLYAPVGMALGADGPREIALEICAEVQKVLSGWRPVVKETRSFASVES